jgi:hypothetical protein
VTVHRPKYDRTIDGHPAPASSVISNRLWATRDTVLGALLLSASSDESVRGILLAGMAADVLDLVSVAFGLLDGSVGVRTAAALGRGGIAAFGLGLVAINGLDGKKKTDAPVAAALIKTTPVHA